MGDSGKVGDLSPHTEILKAFVSLSRARTDLDGGKKTWEPKASILRDYGKLDSASQTLNTIQCHSVCALLPSLKRQTDCCVGFQF